MCNIFFYQIFFNFINKSKKLRLKLTLELPSLNCEVPINYQYPLSAAIYKILANADADYSAFLHDIGYKTENELKSFKLFTFSDLKCPFGINGDRLILKDKIAEVIIAFHLPSAAETFIKGVFTNQIIEIADRKSRLKANISQVEVLSNSLVAGINHYILSPISPLVCGTKNDKGNYDYLSPESPAFIPAFVFNWKEKYKTIYGLEESDLVFRNIEVAIEYYRNPPKSRLITIKAGTTEETKVKGFVNFKLKVKANHEALDIILNAGGGLYNAMGMGCLEVLKTN